MRRLLLVLVDRVAARPATASIGVVVLMLVLASDARAQTTIPLPATTPADAVSPPALQILGYGDANFFLENKGDEPGGNHFGIGEFDLLFLSNLSDSWRLLAEPVIRIEEGEFASELERMIVTYAPRDYFELGLGRYNASFGYYSSTYSHQTYFQTAATRPMLFEFEDVGGILPEHNTGFTVSGRLPGPLRPRYIVEVGNGQPLRRLEEGEGSAGHGHAGVSQAAQDNNRIKAVNLAFHIRPARVPGLQLGTNAYFDTLGPAGEPQVTERIFGAFVAYFDEHWEVLLEGIGINTRLERGRGFRSGGFYTQIARQVGAARPFFRYQSLSVPEGEPGLGYESGRTYGPSVGVRFDPGPFVAVKFQADVFSHEDRATEATFITQVSFAF